MISSIHFMCSLWMMTLIWVVQLLHYPMFLYIPKSNRVIAATFHQQRISWLVMPIMILEWITLIMIGPEMNWAGNWIIMAILLTIIWVATATLQVPCHQKLLENPTDNVVRRLVHSNWIRTICWTLKTMVIGNNVFNII